MRGRALDSCDVRRFLKGGDLAAPRQAQHDLAQR
jgi:hypothetical protein